MNKVILMGRLTRDPDVRYSNGENVTAVARFTLAVDRRFARRDGDQQTADFIGCVAFGRNAEFIEKYFRHGNKVYTTDVVVEEQEFAESKAASDANRSSMGGSYQTPSAPNPMGAAGDGFMNIPDGIDEELPFN